MRKYRLTTTCAALVAAFAAVSSAEALPSPGLQSAADQKAARTSLLEPVTYGYRYGYSYRPYDHYRPYHSYHYYKPWYGYRYSYWKPRHHWHKYY
jgi:hypothetical protein